jgi:uncharacterized protein with ParB-like and HNH nuclease domain
MPLIINSPPKAEPERLSRLVERVNAGEIKIPKFQRNFVWQRSDVLKLLESLLQGYPMGMPDFPLKSSGSRVTHFTTPSFV